MKTDNIKREANIIWEMWTQMWNGDLDKADLIIEDGFYPHLLQGNFGKPKDINNAKTVKEWVARVRGSFRELTYETLAGPFVDEQEIVLCCHWKANGVFSGKTGMPQDIAGDSFLVEGTDILKFRHGKVYECWTQSNVVTLTE